MIYHGVYKDGRIELEGDVDLRPGTRVDVIPSLARKARTGRGAAKTSTRGTARTTTLRVLRSKKARVEAVLSGFGAWADRPEWAGRTSADISLELRRRAAARGAHD